MYENIGGKIKGLAITIFIVETAVAVIVGIFLMSLEDFFIPIGLLVMLIVPMVAWVSSWLLYGFGELVDKTCDIARNTCCEEIKSKSQSEVDYERIIRIEKLRSNGLITEEEYQKVISKEI